MNINNFEQHLNKTILDRGNDYYTNGHIIETYIQGNNQYVFIIEGKEDYGVVVKVDESGEILYSSCDCPYDFGSICKHQVAAYFELFERWNHAPMNETPKQPVLEEVLSTLSKEELINMIVEITKKDRALQNSIIFRYSKSNDTQEIETCRQFIRSIVKKYTGRAGFITYRETYGFVSELEGVLEKTRHTSNTLLALDLAFLLLEEAIESFQYADDSNEEIGCLVTETIDVIEEIAIDRADFNLKKEEIFHKLLEQSDYKVFEGWEEYQIDLLRICAELADMEPLRDTLKRKIEHFIHQHSSNPYKKYSIESMLQILFGMIEKYGTKEEEKQFIQRYLEFTSFRELFISKYVQEKNYHKVIELALEGEKKDKEYKGLVSKWKKIRYTAYKELSYKKEQQKLARELLLEGNFEYFKDLKALAGEKKEDFYTSLKQELKRSKGWQARDMYLMLIEEEHDFDEIMNVVRESPENIEEYAEMLVPHFKDEVINIYQIYIISKASSSSNRKGYKRVCEILQRYKKIAGNQKQEEIINELRAVYNKRPAFVDELSKL